MPLSRLPLAGTVLTAEPRTDLGDSETMMAHLNTTVTVLGWCVGGKEVGWRGVCGLALGAGLSPTQVINTLINSSAHIIIKTTGREWWGWNILMEFTQL